MEKEDFQINANDVKTIVMYNANLLLCMTANKIAFDAAEMRDRLNIANDGRLGNDVKQVVSEMRRCLTLVEYHKEHFAEREFWNSFYYNEFVDLICAINKLKARTTSQSNGTNASNNIDNA